MVEQYTPEQYTLATWRGAEAAFKGELKEPDDAGPPPEPHPNDIATREAVKQGIYSAEDVGVEPSDVQEHENGG